MKYSLDQIVDKLQLLVHRMREHEDTVDKVTHEVVKLETQMMNKDVVCIHRRSFCFFPAETYFLVTYLFTIRL